MVRKAAAAHDRPRAHDHPRGGRGARGRDGDAPRGPGPWRARAVWPRVQRLPRRVVGRDRHRRQPHRPEGRRAPVRARARLVRDRARARRRGHVHAHADRRAADPGHRRGRDSADRLRRDRAQPAGSPPTADVRHALDGMDPAGDLRPGGRGRRRRGLRLAMDLLRPPAGPGDLRVDGLSRPVESRQQARGSCSGFGRVSKSATGSSSASASRCSRPGSPRSHSLFCSGSASRASS